MRDLRFPVKGLHPEIVKYMVEDEFLIQSDIFNENKEICDFYHKGLKNFNWKLPEDIQSGQDEQQK